MPETLEIPVLIARTLAGLGASICFGVAGSTNFKVTAALEAAGVRFVAARHECNAVAMADGYARQGAGFALASVHAGPGLTNAITAIGEAAKSSTPLLILAGDVANGDHRSNFFIDQSLLAKAVGAEAERIFSLRTAQEDTIRAFRKAFLLRKTVVLNIPMDIQENVSPQWDEAGDLPVARTPVPDEKSIRQLADMLVDAKRPLILAGRGAVISNARGNLLALAEATGALVATSACGHGLFAEDPWSLGISGGFSSPVAAGLIGQGDLLVGFGTTLTHWTTRAGRLIHPQACVVQVDADISRLGMNAHVDWGIAGDADATADALLQEIARRKQALAPPKWRTHDMKAKIAAGDLRHAHYVDASDDRVIDPRTLSIALDAILPDNRLVATDGGHFMGWPAQYLRVPDEEGWCFAMAFSSTGLGLGTAIGAGLARPERLTVLCAGDGGFSMSIPDLETAVRLKQRLCIIVYNDSCYAAEVHEFGPLGYATNIAEFTDFDFAGMARGFGIKAVTVRQRNDLAALEAWIADGAEGVFLVDAKVNARVKAEWFLDLMEGKHH